MLETDLTTIIAGEVLYLDNNGKVAGGGMYRVEIIAQLFGVTVRRIQQLTQEGVLPTTETVDGRRHDLVPTIQSYVQYLSDKAYGKNRSEKELELKEQKMKAEIALKESQGELHQLKTAIAAGKYIAVEEVIVEYQSFFLQFKKFAKGIAPRLVDTVGDFVELNPLQARQLEKTISLDVDNQLSSFVLSAVTELSAKAKQKNAKP